MPRFPSVSVWQQAAKAVTAYQGQCERMLAWQYRQCLRPQLDHKQPLCQKQAMTAFCGALPCVTLTAEQIRIVVIRSAKVGDLEVSEGDMVAVTPSDKDSCDEAGLQFCMVQAMWQTQKAKMMQVSLQCNL